MLDTDELRFFVVCAAADYSVRPVALFARAEHAEQWLQEHECATDFEVLEAYVSGQAWAGPGSPKSAETTLRECPIEGCTEPCSEWEILCHTHWRQVPAFERSALHRHFIRGNKQTKEYYEALRNVVLAIKPRLR